MEAKNDIIVALEFGTSSIRGIAGRKLADGSVQILGIEREDALDNIQKGVIYNIDRTAQAIRDIVGRLGDTLNMRITKAYVGLAGQSLHTKPNTIERKMDTTVKITPEVTNNMMDINREEKYSGAEILDVVTQEYVVGQKTVADPVGIQNDYLEAHFLNIVAKNAMKENIDKCMRIADVQVAEHIIAPVALANTVLTTAEKRSGCALIDFGAGTTTVSYYKDNILRRLVTIPLGGNSITGDLMNQKQMDFEDAERLKRKYGVAYTSMLTDQPRQISYGDERSVDENELLDIISARQEEIILNAWNQLKDVKDSMLSGIIIAGGAAQMNEMTSAITTLTETERVKSAKSLIVSADVADSVKGTQNICLDMLITLLMHGDECCVCPIESDKEEERRRKEEEEEELRKREEEEKEKEEKRKREEEEKEKQRKLQEEEERKRKKNGFFKRLGKGLKSAIEKLQEEEEE